MSKEYDLVALPESNAGTIGMQLKIIDPLQDKRWDEFVRNHPRGSIYHHSLWKEVVQRTYGYEPYYVVLEKQNRIRAALPVFFVKSLLTGRRLVCLPFSDHCDPLTNNEEEFDLLFSRLVKQADLLNADQIELKVKGDSLPVSRFAFAVGGDHRNHILELTGSLNNIKKGFHKSCIVRNIRKAQKSDVAIMCGNTEEDMRTFFRLQVRTRKRHGLPTQPYKFFKNIWSLFYPVDMLQVWLAISHSRPIAGIITLKFKETMYYLYGGSDDRFHHFRPNHLLLWSAIQAAHREQLTCFDFGRTSKDNTGLIDFKRRWGAKEYHLTSFTFCEGGKTKWLPNRGPGNGLISNLNKKLPTSLLHLAGRLIYRHLG